jgi:hypothetical protein
MLWLVGLLMMCSKSDYHGDDGFSFIQCLLSSMHLWIS